MVPRWMIERKRVTRDKEHLQVIVLYAENEELEQVKDENKQWTFKKCLIR